MNKLKAFGDLTILDWIVLIHAVTETVGLLLFPVVALAYKDAIRCLVEKPSTLTTLAVSPSFSFFLGLTSCGLLFVLLNCSRESSLKKRRCVLWASFLLSSLALGICISAILRPLIEAPRLSLPELSGQYHSALRPEEILR